VTVNQKVDYKFEKYGWYLQSADYHFYSGWKVNMVNTEVEPMRNSYGLSKLKGVDGLNEAMENAIETQLTQDKQSSIIRG